MTLNVQIITRNCETSVAILKALAATLPSGLTSSSDYLGVNESCRTCTTHGFESCISDLTWL